MPTQLEHLTDRELMDAYEFEVTDLVDLRLKADEASREAESITKQIAYLQLEITRRSLTL